MAGRGRTSYQKRVKEQARLERRQQKEARKQARKAARSEGAADISSLTEQQPLPEETSPLNAGDTAL